MLFQSQGFALIFLPLAVASYYAAARSVVARQCVLIVASLVFYGWWDARFIILLVGQISASWLLAWIAARIGKSWPLYAGIVLNLASLATFKYLDFLLASVQALMVSSCRGPISCCRSASASFRFSSFPISSTACAMTRRSIRSGRSPCSCCCFHT